MFFKPLLIIGYSLILISFKTLAQDVAGSSDHLLFGLIPGFSIKEYAVEDSGRHTFYIENNEKIVAEGKKTTIYYECNCEESPLKIIRSFSDAIKKFGGKSLEYANNKVYINLKREGVETLAEVSAGENYYTLIIIEKAGEKQDKDLASIHQALSKSGSAIFYIPIDSGSPIISSESMALIGQVIQLLILEPSLQLSIEGLADSTGTKTADQKQMEEKALAIKKAITDKGIDAIRINIIGYGKIISNDDYVAKDGKDLNREAILVKLYYQ